MANDEFREDQTTARQHGLVKRHETRLTRATVHRAAEVIAEKYTKSVDLANRREDWTYPERSMSDRIRDEVDSSYHTGEGADRSYVLKAPTCLEIAELLAEAGLLKEASND